MAFDIGSIFDSRDSINYLVSQYIALESRPRNQIIESREKLTKKQRELLVDFAKSCGDKDADVDEGIIDKAKRFFEGED